MWLAAEEERVAEDIFAWILAWFMEAVHVELPNEAVDIAVPKVFGGDMLLKLIDLLDGKLAPIAHPVDYGLILLVF